jgi:hypothetical protein
MGSGTFMSPRERIRRGRVEQHESPLQIGDDHSLGEAVDDEPKEPGRDRQLTSERPPGRDQRGGPG